MLRVLPTGTDDSTLGLVDFSIFPHLDDETLPKNTMEMAPFVAFVRERLPDPDRPAGTLPRWSGT